MQNMPARSRKHNGLSANFITAILLARGWRPSTWPHSPFYSHLRSEIAVLLLPLLQTFLQFSGMGGETLGIWRSFGQIAIHSFEAGGKLGPCLVHFFQAILQSRLLVRIQALQKSLVVALHTMTQHFIPSLAGFCPVRFCWVCRLLHVGGQHTKTFGHSDTGAQLSALFVGSLDLYFPLEILHGRIVPGMSQAAASMTSMLRQGKR